MKFLILNGPNLNIMRWSEPGVPGELDYNAIMDYVQAGCEQLGIETDCCQSNHEGDLVDEIQAAAGRVDGIVLNPGAYAHYSVAILDALRLCGVPAVEVMLHAPDFYERRVRPLPRNAKVFHSTQRLYSIIRLLRNRALTN